MLSMVDVSVVVPVRNAEGSITHALESLVSRLAVLGGRHEVVVVDDASDDASAQEAQRLARLLPEVRVIPLHSRSGSGFAGRHGLLAAAGVHRVLLPVLQGTAAALPGTWEDALARVRGGAAVVVGVRSKVLALDSRVALRVVESAVRHGTSFAQEVVRLGKQAGLRVDEVVANDPRGGVPGPPLSRTVRGFLSLVVDFRWPRGPGKISS